MSKVKIFAVVILIFIVIVLVYQIKKVKAESLLTTKAEIENSDFYNIYTKILNPSCGKAGCHDGGSIEPDFSTVSSSYYTLVWQPITKGDRKGIIQYRVVPYDVEKSGIYERITNCCFVDKNDRMPFHDPDGLAQKDIDLIAKWISEGAKDIYGKGINVPEPLIGLSSMNITYKDENGNTKSDFKEKINTFNEVYSRIVPTNAQSIHIDLMVENGDKFSLKLYLYSDSDYSKVVKKLNPIEKYDGAKISFDISKSSLLNQNKTIFFRLIDSKGGVYSYPNPQVNSTERFLWSFYWANDNEINSN